MIPEEQKDYTVRQTVVYTIFVLMLDPEPSTRSHTDRLAIEGRRSSALGVKNKLIFLLHQFAKKNIIHIENCLRRRSGG